MTTRNDVTGDALTTGATSDAYRDNYDRIFRPVCFGQYGTGQDCGTCKHSAACGRESKS